MGVLYGPLWNDKNVRWHPLARPTAYDEIFAPDLLDKVCTVCGEQMTFPGIFWGSATGELYFHPACVVHWMIRLMRDVHEAECTTHCSTTRYPPKSEPSA